MTAYHIGIDLHTRVAQVCVRNAKGAIHRDRRFSINAEHERARMLDWIGGFGPEARYAVEALGCNRWFVLACRERGLDLLVVDATQLGLKRQGRKTDKRDAREIARRLHLGDLDRHARTYFPTEEEYGLRKLVRTKHALTRKRTGCLARIRGLLNAYALRPPTTTLYTRQGLAWLRSLELSTEDLDFSLQALVDVLEVTHRQVVRLAARIEKRAREQALGRWLMDNVHQAGAQTALTLIAEFGDARRFQGARQVGSYGGTVPRVTASADRAHHGRMTKRGNRELRYILGQWAVRLLATNSRVKAWARPMLRRMHKNKVRMALARRLLVGVWVMFSRGEVFSLARCLGRAA